MMNNLDISEVQNLVRISSYTTEEEIIHGQFLNKVRPGFLHTVRQNLNTGLFTVVLRNKLKVMSLYTTR